jgi:methionine-rich copper-binding protein CopC
MKCRALLAVPFLLALLALPGRALAHAHLVRADLAPNSHLLVSVGTVRFWFDEPLNPALSQVRILNRQGHQVNGDTGTLNAGNDEELDVTIPTLSDGIYSVHWTRVSAQDGQILHGSYLFTVGGPGAVVPPALPATVGGSDGASLDASGVTVALAHWLVLVATALWTGALALEVLVLAPAMARPQGETHYLATAASRRAGRIVRVGADRGHHGPERHPRVRDTTAPARRTLATPRTDRGAYLHLAGNSAAYRAGPREPHPAVRGPDGSGGATCCGLRCDRDTDRR